MNTLREFWSAIWNLKSADLAAWVQAIGTVEAIVAAIKTDGLSITERSEFPGAAH